MPNMVEPRQHSAGSTPPSLLQRARENDGAAWGLLVEWASDVVLACCRRAGLQDADRDDVFWAVFQRAWQNLGKFERRTSFRSWVASIARNQINDLFRAQREEKIRADFVEQNPPIAVAVPFADIADEGGARDIQQAIQLWLRQATDHNKHDTAFRAFYRMTVDQLSGCEVADELGITEEAVRQYKYRWTKRLRHEFAAAFGDLLATDPTKRPGWPV